MADAKLRFNDKTEEVEFVVDERVVMSSGADVFKSWVDFYNEQHKPVKTLDEPVVEEKEPPVEVVPEVKTEEVKLEVDTD